MNQECLQYLVAWLQWLFLYKDTNLHTYYILGIIDFHEMLPTFWDVSTLQTWAATSTLCSGNNLFNANFPLLHFYHLNCALLHGICVSLLQTKTVKQLVDILWGNLKTTALIIFLWILRILRILQQVNQCLDPVYMHSQVKHLIPSSWYVMNNWVQGRATSLQLMLNITCTCHCTMQNGLFWKVTSPTCLVMEILGLGREGDLIRRYCINGPSFQQL